MDTILKISGDLSKQQAYKQLLEEAKKVAENAYAPYSNFPVGAAILGEDGRVFIGCNVENAAWATICAERAAVVSAIAHGVRKFTAVAVFCKKVHDAWPCGVCRQYVSEFGLEIDVVTEAPDGTCQVKKMSELFPNSFGPADVSQ